MHQDHILQLGSEVVKLMHVRELFVHEHFFNEQELEVQFFKQ